MDDANAPRPALLVPEYAAPLQAELTPTQQSLATSAAWFGAIPLALGCIDFLMWVVFRDDIFAFGGLIIILIGLLLTFIGGLLLLILLCSIRGTGKLKLFFKTSRLAIFLILVNYPVAYGIILMVIQMSHGGYNPA